MWFVQIANSNQLQIKTGSFEGITGNAAFNSNRSRRYFLEKRWEQGGKILTAIMMNPSNAAHNKSDKTVDQLINVARNQSCHALYVVNVSSVIDGSSSNLNTSKFAYDPINWSFITGAISEAKIVFIGWGLKGHNGILMQQKSNPSIINTFRNALNKTYCYEVLKSTDKKYVNKPLHYVPHPRPLYEQDKYIDVEIQKLNDFEFTRLFIR
ncbi:MULTISPECIES: DUF1643 domain-containing protein [Paenibacillus]|uniref:DUF1643 domain-containing protein n=1 Tax=Paenibacillus albilobatus TaxID=2716884 RepID=A0A919XHF3_9BACL|nr:MULTISPECIES: DUF1643 domain-containing protein [Paenibacillus]GIO31784.1 hypothetical protein J2TS6_29250 [Paenibacillus albilobatus]